MIVAKQQAVVAFRRFFILSLCVFLGLLVYVKLSVRHYNIQACERGAVAAAQDAKAWGAAENARRAAYAKGGDPVDLRAAETYAETVRQKTARAELDCGAAYPIL